jgi:hypothetical protein
MKKAFKWLAERPAVIFGFIATALGFILYAKWKADQANTLKDALVVAKAEKEIAVLDVKREEADKRVAAREVMLTAVDKALDVNKRKIVEARTGAKDLSSDEITAEYKRLGYL